MAIRERQLRILYDREEKLAMAKKEIFDKEKSKREQIEFQNW